MSYFKKLAFYLIALSFLTVAMFFANNFVEAGSGSYWHCADCGQEVFCGGNSTPKDYSTCIWGCGNDINKKHNWQYGKKGY